MSSSTAAAASAYRGPWSRPQAQDASSYARPRPSSFSRPPDCTSSTAASLARRRGSFSVTATTAAASRIREVRSATATSTTSVEGSRPSRCPP